MNPYRETRVQALVSSFLDRFYDDSAPRRLVLGINPGRFGAGITGITFTDPVALAEFCGIDNSLPRRRELSSVFIYDVIYQMGGPAAFFRQFFLSAVSPLGFTRDGRNMNYYDDPALARATTPFIVRSIEQHLELGGRRDRVIVLGLGKNAAFLTTLNEKHRWFEEIVALEHPRSIMQYRRRRVAEYIERYRETLEDKLK